MDRNELFHSIAYYYADLRYTNFVPSWSRLLFEVHFFGNIDSAALAKAVGTDNIHFTTLEEAEKASKEGKKALKITVVDPKLKRWYPNAVEVGLPALW